MISKLLLNANYIRNMENEIIKCIKERRSIRNFEEKKLPEDVIESIIEAGKYAPSPENRQPWRFIVVTNRQKIKELSGEIKKQIKKILKNKWKWQRRYPELKEADTLLFLKVVANSSKDIIFYDAPAVIFIITKPLVFNIEACSCAAQNMMLAAWSMSVGSCWIGFAKFLELNKEIMQDIGVPEGYVIASCLAFGYPARIPKAAIRKPMTGIINWID
ncbi:MAG: nitroreductase family protein [Thermoplasmata archaeon]|nr:MAG: nitroreductase family protein [Thermoplasmata archaeon]